MKAISFVVLLLAMVARSSFGQSYQLVDLAALLGTNSYAQGINNDGQVVGYWETTNGAHAFLYQNGAMTDLGLLGRLGTNNFALSINNSGQVVGFSETTNGAVAFIYQNGGVTNLSNFGGLGSYAFGINDGGQIVGHVATDSGAAAFLYNNGVVTSLGSLGGSNSFAYGVNNALQVAGSSLKADNVTTHAFLWQNGVIRDLNQLLPYNSGWELMEAHGINDYGSIAGWGIIGAQAHAFLYYNGGWAVDLGTLPGSTNSYALGLNRSNVVVGVSLLPSGARAVIWQGGTMTDLNGLINASGWELKEATGINDSGQIVGWGVTNAEERAFLIQPVSQWVVKSVQPVGGKVAKISSVATTMTSASVTSLASSTLSISITNPINSIIYTVPTNLVINASATDSGGTVTQVQFYVGTRLLAAGTNAPYSTIWSNAVMGIHALTAVARDNVGTVATSSVVNVSIATNLLATADAYVRDGSYTNTNYGTNTVMQCLTTTTNGNNRDVYFKFNLTGLSNISSAKLSFFAQLSGTGFVSNTVYSVTNTSWGETNITWSNKPVRVSALMTNSVMGTNWFLSDVSSYVTSQATNGLNVISLALHDPTNYSLLLSINSRENSSNQPALVIVTTNSPLNVVITNPANGSVFAVPTNLAINASVSDSDGTVTQVLFFQGTNKLGSVVSAPYSLTWSNASSGSYALTAVASDSSGLNTTSGIVNVVFDIPPSFSAQPTNQVVKQGSNVVFSVTAAGTTPLSYRWLFNGTNLAGATNFSLTITNVQATNAGSYSVVLTNVVGSATSTNAVLTLLTAPSITVQPTNAVVLQGSNATFSVTASGTTPSSYQWSFNGTNVAGATNSVYAISNAQTNNAGSYWVTITNVVGTVTSSNAVLTVQVPPFILMQPTNAAVKQGSNAVFSVTAGGTTPLSYRWLLNGTNLAGATSVSLTITNVQATNAGSYSVVVTNVVGSVTSTNAVLTMLAAPSITVQPTNAVVLQGSNATFSVTASGTTPLNYQWYFNGTNVAGATNSAYTVNNAQTNNAGGYTVSVTNLFGSVTSTNAVLTVRVPPFIITQPTNAAVKQGSNVTFSVTAGGTMPLSYLWLLGGTNVAGATNVSLTITNVQATNVGSYSVVVTNVVGSVTSTNVYLSLLTAPSISVQPTNLMVLQGSNAMFSITASGTTPLNYQWYFNGTNVAGATNSGYAVSNAQTNNAGSYSVIITNVVGSVTSTNAVLTVRVPPFIMVQPTNATVIKGSNAVFSITAGGTTPLSYRWLFNGTNVAGATNFSLTITNVQATNTGSYSVVVTNVVGSVTSTNAVLALLTAPSISVQPTNLMVLQGSNATFSITASGTTPLIYQWYFNGTNLAGGTNNVYTVSNAQTNNAGSYSVTITNVVGGVTSTNAVLTVRVPPFIVTQPTNQAVMSGGNATFAVTPGGTAPLSYRWRFNGTNMTGAATNLLLTVTNVTSAKAGNYSVVVTNVVGSVTSSVASLMIVTPPSVSITNPVSNSMFTVGSNLVLSATASDANGSIAQVRFYQKTNWLGTLTNSPYTLIWSNLLQGAYFFTAVAVDSFGLASTSSVVNVSATPLPASIGAGDVDLWYRADSLTGLTNGAIIYTWPDSLGRGQDAIDINAPAYPGPVYVTNAVNGYPACGFMTNNAIWAPEFNGTNNSAELFAVLKVGDPRPSYWSSPWHFGGSTTWSQYPASDGSIWDDFASTGMNSAGIPSTPLTQYHVFEESGTNGFWAARINGEVIATLANNTFGYAALAGGVSHRTIGTGAFGSYSSYFNGDIAEIITFNRLLSDSERQAVEIYLVHKYGIIVPPSVTLTNPANYAILTNWSDISLEADASDEHGTISQVQFFQGGSSLGIVTNPPYILTWTNPPAGSYMFTAQATDDAGLTATSSVVNAFVCGPTLLSDMTAWWRAEGNALDSVGTNNGVLSGGVTYGSGEVGQGFNFDGSSGFVATSILVNNPQNFSLDLWFKTSSSGGAGGALMGFGDSQFDTANNYDRLLFMDDSGLLHFGVYNSGFQMVDSAISYNDGVWHHAAVTIYINSGTALYVDGTLVASNSTATTGYNFAGWWRIGQNNLSGWPSIPSSYYFDGEIDEVSIYDHPLSAADVQSIYKAGSSGKAPNLSISITNPVSNTWFLMGSNINLGATMSDAGGSAVTEFMFLAGTNVLGMVTNPPYAMVWTNPPPGSYQLTACATDNSGLSGTSAVVNVMIASPPSVTLTSPVSGAWSASGSNISMTAFASDMNGGIAQVEFFQGTNALGAITDAPYVLTWNNVATGFYSLTALATDTLGLASTSAPVEIIVGSPLTVSLVSPSNALAVSAGSINLTASVTDIGGTVGQVQFFSGSSLLGTVSNSPYSLTFTNLAAGTYALTAQAQDASGLTATSSVAVVYVLPSGALQSTLTNMAAWWRAEGNALDSMGTNNGLQQGNVSYASGEVGSAFLFDGSTGFIATSQQINSPQNFTLELWFKTTTTNGGALMGFNDSQLQVPYSHDRVLFMDNSGRLHFGIWQSGPVMVDSPSNYNDGVWHHVAATSSSSTGTALFVDGVLVAANSAALTPQSYPGWWRIGESQLGWANANSPSSYYFEGLIDEVSLFDRVLAAGEIKAIYDAGSAGKGSSFLLLDVGVLNPTNYTAIAMGSGVNLSAYAWCASGNISQVQLFVETNLLATFTNAPYALLCGTNWNVGPYALTAVAYCNNGLVQTSAVVNVFVDQPPTVVLTNPISQSVIPVGTNFNLEASVSNFNSATTVVDFYQGTNFIGAATAPPYAISWTGASNGAYTFTAEVVDTFGLISTSAPVTIYVGYPMTVMITNPPINAITYSGTNIDLSVNIADLSSGSISQVRYFLWSSLLGVATNAPYDLMVSNLPVGTYSITALASDNGGFSATSSAAIFYVSPPLTNLMSWWRAESNALDSVGTNNGILLGNMAFAPGKVGLAYAFDGTSGFVATSQHMNGPQDYTVECWFRTTTTQGGGLIGFCNSQSGPPSANDRPVYMDNSGRLHFGISNGGCQMADSQASYNDGRWHHLVATMSSTNGSALYVDAVLVASNPRAAAQFSTGWWRLGENDLNGWPYKPSNSYFSGLMDEVCLYNCALSAATIQLLYQAGGSGNLPCLNVALTSPGNDSVIPLGTAVGMNAVVSDPNGVVNQVRLYNGNTLLVTATNAPYTWTLTNLASGTYSLSAQASDNYGIMATSSVANVIIDALPAVALTQPVNNSAFLLNSTFNLGVVASDSDGYVTQVQWFQGTNLIGSTASAPYDLTLTCASVGNYSFTACATDNDGLSSTSTVVNIVVDASPIVSISTPTNGAVILGNPTNVLLSATASDSNGIVTQVQFYQGGVCLGVVTNAPYSLSWSNVPAGNYAVTAVAVNNYGFTNVSAAVNFVVDPVYVAITNPASICVFTAIPTNIILNASAGDVAGVVTQVQYFQGATSLGIVTNPPYTLAWSNITNSCGVSAVASDDHGCCATSAVVWVMVAPFLTASNVQLWLKADAITGLTNNAPLAVWPDSSGQTNNATQGNFGQQPLYLTNMFNGYPVVQFNGGSYFNLPNFLGGTVGAEAFVVLRAATNTPAVPSELWTVGGATVWHSAYPAPDGSLAEDFGSTTMMSLGVPAQPLNEYNVYEVMGQNGSWAAWLNGVLLACTTNSVYGYTSTPMLGRRYTPGNGVDQYFNGAVAELLVFNRPLSDSERTTVNNYLKGKYGLVPPVPATPTNVVATAISSTQIGLSWSETLTGSGMTQISIERATASNGVFAVVAQVGNTLSYVDTNLAPNITYYYRVRAINLEQWSGYSGLAQAGTFEGGADVPFGNLALWLKADSGLVQGGSSMPVNQWADQSGNGMNAIQNSPYNRPQWVAGALNGLPAVQFNGSYFTLPNFLGGTVGAEAFVVLRAATNTPAVPSELWTFGGATVWHSAYPATDGSLAEDFGSTTMMSLGVPAQPLNQYNVYEVMGQNGNWDAWLNGVLLASTTNSVYGYNSTPMLGRRYTPGNGVDQYFNGAVAELLVFNRPLSDSERTTVNNYLKGKYGLVPPVPATPTNLVAMAISSTQIGLSWSETLTGRGMTQISIERATASNGVFGVVAQVGNALSYVDTNLVPNATYYYRVRAINLEQWSDYSSVAQAGTFVGGADVPFGNLALWLKADAGLVQGGSNMPVNQWADQSGNGKNAIQTSGNNRPQWVARALNGLPEVQFNGSSFFYLPNFLGGTVGAEAFVVLRAATNTPAVPSELWSFGGATTWHSAYPAPDGSLTEDFGSTTMMSLGVPAQPLNQYNVYEVMGQNGIWAAWLNGMLQGSTTNSVYGYNSTPMLGRRYTPGNGVDQYFNGAVAELLVFNRSLSDSERTTVNNYLKGKYGLVPPVPATPTNLAAMAISSTQIGLSWSETLTGGGMTQISIERATASNGVFGVVAQVGNALSYVDTNLVPNATYYYRVRALNLEQWSGYSSVAHAGTFGGGADVPFGNLALWLKADSGLVQGGGSMPVNQWVDQSGNGMNAIQNSPYNRPQWVPGALNGIPAVQFNGSSFFNLPNFLGGTVGAEAFVMLRAATNTPAVTSELWSFGGATTWHSAYPAPDGSLAEDFGSTTMMSLGVPAEPVNQYNVYEVMGQNGSWAMWMNGILQDSTTNSVYGYNSTPMLGRRFTPGNGVDQYFNGAVAELLVFNRPLTDSERTNVNSYLITKYGLTPKAPVNFVATPVSLTQIELLWAEPLDNKATRISIERSLTSNGVYQVVAELPLSTAYMDTNLTPGTTYYYRARAINTVQYYNTPYSAYSAIAQATTWTNGVPLPTEFLAMWLRADAGLVTNASGQISCWMDQSGARNNATQSDIGAQPAWVPNAIGGRPVVRFDGLSASFTLPNFMDGAASGEAFVVLKAATNNPGPLWELGGDGWNGKSYGTPDSTVTTIGDDFGSFGQMTSYDQSGVHTVMTAQALDQYHLYDVSSQTNDWDAWINGVMQCHSDVNTVNFSCAPTLGSSVWWGYICFWEPYTSYFAGDIAEILVFNRSLTPDERTAVGAYLNGKYSLVPEMPATPSNLVATAIAPTQVALTWNETVNAGATRVSIERLNPTNQTYQELAEVACATTYWDTNAFPGTTCYYRVRAINIDQWTPYSAAAAATTPGAGASVPLADLATWLRADDGVWLTTNAVPLEVWPDASGHQNHASQLHLASLPLWLPGTNGQRPTLFFNGTNTTTTLPSFQSSSAEAFVVLKTSVTNELHSLWDFGGPDGYAYKSYPDVDGSISDNFGSDTIYHPGVPPQLLNQFHVYEAASEWDNWEAWINGTLFYQSSEASFNTVDFSGGMVLGSSSYLVADESSETGFDVIPVYFAGNISEMLLFNRTLTDGERAAVNTYLARKYALAPVVAITSPANNAVIAGVTNLTLSATAADNAGIAQIEFRAGSTSLGTVTNLPYSLLWSNVPLGSYPLTALATDNHGMVFTSAVVNLTVAGIAITSPTNHAVFPAPATIPINVTAVDAAGIGQLQLFQGTNLLATLTNEPYSFIWSNAPAGADVLMAVATDEFGLSMTSSVVNVTVDSLPSVTLTNPLNNASFAAGANISLAATAAAGDGVASVQFFAGTNLLGVAAAAPYNFIWTNAPLGAYALTAQATDNLGLVSTSAVVNIMVAGITITNPPNNVVLAAPATLNLGATVTDNATITRVQFFSGTNSLAILTSPPYAYTWASVTPGVYTLTATGQDSTGLVFTSAPVTVIVDTNPNTTNRSGDGQSDYLDYLQGRNPLVGTVPDTNNVINFQVYTPLQ